MAQQSLAKETPVEATTEVEETPVVEVPSDSDEAEKRPAGEPEEEPETKKAKTEENGVENGSDGDEESNEEDKDDEDDTKEESDEKPVEPEPVKTLESSEDIKKAEA